MRVELKLLISFFLQMHERVENLICEQTLADMMYLTENGGMLRLDNL